MKAIFCSFFHANRHVYTCLVLAAILGLAIPSYAEKKRVLFLGNSYTHFNNMPQIVADMALTTGDTLIFSMYAPGAYTFDNHGSDTVSENKIKQGGWDYLILQEQSQLPSFPTYFSPGLYSLCSLFRSYNPCGRIIFYMTWGRKNGDASNCPNWPPVCTYSGMDSLLRLRYTQMAIDNNAELSPAGAAWRYTRLHHPFIELYNPDESHPSVAGSYLVASCFYTAIFKKDPTLVNYNFGLSTASANTLKQSAKAVVFDSLSFWDYTPTTPAANFNYTIGNSINQVNLINYSSFADSYSWDFGDGTTSTAQHPIHNYTSNGTYTVTMHAYNCDIDTTYKSSHQMEITFCPFTPTITPQELALCPSTSDTLSTQLYDAYQWYDMDYNAVPGATTPNLVVSAYNRYYVKATLNGCSERSEPVPVTITGNTSMWSIVPAGELISEDSACIGATITLIVSFNKLPGADDSFIDWRFNGAPIAGYHNDTLLITQTGVYEAKVRHDRCTSLDLAKQINFTFVPCGLGVEGPEKKPFVVAPNPTYDILSISSTAFLSATYNIKLVNQLGQTIHQQQSKAEEIQNLDISRYPGGIYFVSVSRAGHVIYRNKILKL